MRRARTVCLCSLLSLGACTRSGYGGGGGDGPRKDSPAAALDAEKDKHVPLLPDVFMPKRDGRGDLLPKVQDGAVPPPSCLGAGNWGAWSCKLGQYDPSVCDAKCGKCELHCDAGDCTCKLAGTTGSKSCSVSVYLNCAQCETARAKGCCDVVCAGE
jgi:hypothetical protein